MSTTSFKDMGLLKEVDFWSEMLLYMGCPLAYYHFSQGFKYPLDQMAIASLVPLGIYLGFKCLRKIQLSDDEKFIKIGDLWWSLADFVRGWLITGKTGSGKTAAAICNILIQLFKKGNTWGSLMVDDKGLFWKIPYKMAKVFGQQDRIKLLQTRPRNAKPDWKPGITYNLIGDLETTASSYAKTIVETFFSINPGERHPFFVPRAQTLIGRAIEGLRLIDPKLCTLNNVAELFVDDNCMREFLEALADMAHLTKARKVINIFTQKYLQVAKETKDGIEGNILNMLENFTEPELAEVFSSEDPTLNFSDAIDGGAIIIVNIPQKYEVERAYVNTFLKLAYFKHGLRRFDKEDEERADDKLLILIADEAQHVVTSATAGLGDAKVIDRLREAKCTVIYATQSTTSFSEVLKESAVKVLLLNIGNHIYFTMADEEAANKGSVVVGKIKRREYTYTDNGKGPGSRSYKMEWKPRIDPNEMLQWPKFHCVIKHVERGAVEMDLMPTEFTTPTERSSGRGYKCDPKEKDQAAENPEDVGEELMALSSNPHDEEWPRSEIDSSVKKQ